MKIDRIMPSVMGIIIIALLALATSCATNKIVNNNAGHYGINPRICPAYN
tara:strand:+ start:157 stop:306 length:150 start_codon:yes stop_codon:yes gene_type:complete